MFDVLDEFKDKDMIFESDRNDPFNHLADQKQMH